MRILLCVILLIQSIMPMENNHKTMIVALESMEKKNNMNTNCRQFVDESNELHDLIIIDLHEPEPLKVEEKAKRCECTKPKAIIIGALITACSAITVSFCGVIGVIIVALIKNR